MKAPNAPPHLTQVERGRECVCVSERGRESEKVKAPNAPPPLTQVERGREGDRDRDRDSERQSQVEQAGERVCVRETERQRG